ncbi:MAG: hypothetical protein OER80_14020 [Gammaproteobacteria bacterium]|nr:hypothetical protein [Gammaproteobacteria bacterium]
MSEDHIKTIVIDPPLRRHADDKVHDEPHSERSEPDDSKDNHSIPQYRSWLT